VKRDTLIVLAIAASAALAGWLLTHRAVSPGVNATAEGKGRVLYWYDPMRVPLASVSGAAWGNSVTSLNPS